MAGAFLHTVLVAPPSTAALTDRELLARFVTEGDEAAFTALVKRHGPDGARALSPHITLPERRKSLSRPLCPTNTVPHSCCAAWKAKPTRMQLARSAAPTGRCCRDSRRRGNGSAHASHGAAWRQPAW